MKFQGKVRLYFHAKSHVFAQLYLNFHVIMSISDIAIEGIGKVYVRKEVLLYTITDLDGDYSMVFKS